MAKESSAMSNGTKNGIPKTQVCREQTPVAILGFGCRLPGQCNSPRALWDFLARGFIAKHDPPPNDPCRFNLAAHYDGSTKPGTMASPGGMFLEEVDLAAFDASFFNLSRTDATSMDPQQRLLLEVTYECLENCGITLEQIRGTNAGCIVAVNSGGNHKFCSAFRKKPCLTYFGLEYEGTLYRDPEDLAPGRTTGFNRSILSNRISHFLDIHGPSITVDTACSGTMTAIDLACQYLQLGGADSMIVAGANLYIDPVTLQDSGPMKEAFSRSGRCHAFDAKADGYIRAEAINTVVLKRLDDAVQDGDPIRAVIRGTAATSDGHTPGLTSPNPTAQAAAIRAAYRNAGITCFDDTGYLECHGTGTYSGDPLEVEGLASVFAPTRPLHKPLIIGSIKSNIGHSEAAAGLSGIIKAAMIVEKGVIPGNPTFISPNPGIDFERSRVRVAEDTAPWPDYAPIRRASVNSFGFGGANGHCVLEAFESRLNGHREPARFISSFGEGGMASWMNYDDKDGGVDESKPLRLLLFSANDRDALTENVKAISNHLIHPAVAVSLNDVAYTLSERRTHHFHRAFLVTDSADFVAGTETAAKKRAQPPRVGFVFTGQGAQWSAMGRDLINRFPLAKTVVAKLDAALQSLPEPPPWSLLNDLTQKREPSYLRQPEISQPLVTALQLALIRILHDWGIRPEGGVVGHSSGEIAAAVAAGLITEDTAIKVAYLRGKAAMQRPPQHAMGMLAVGLSLEQAQGYLTEPTLHVACFNSPTSLTISGLVADLEQVRVRVQRDGHFARMLQVDLAYHSEYMADIATRYESLLIETCANSGQGFSDHGTVPMVSSVTGLVMEPGVIPDATYWKNNMTNPVRFAQAASELLTREGGPEFLVEVGPSNALAGPISQIIASLGRNFSVQYTSAAKRGAGTLLPLLDVAGRLWANGGRVDMTKVNTYDNPSLVVDLPNYRWNHSNRYWHQGFASEEWRHRKFVSHDLLGSKIPGIGWEAPCWLRVIRLQDLPWLKHHEHAGQFLFPASGFLAMAMEAVYQTTVVNEWSAYGKTHPAAFNYHLEDVQFLRGLELSETSGVRVITTLTPVHASLKPWHQFKIMSVGFDGSTSINCIGLARISQRSCLPSPPPGTIDPLKYPYKAEQCYKMMHSSGWKYGPHFQRLVEVQWTWGESHTLGSLSMAEPPSTYQQSRYPIHPVSLDSLLQIAAFSVFQQQQNFSTVEVLVPARIGSLVIPSGSSHSSTSRVVVSAELAGRGKKETATSYRVSGAAFDPKDEHCILEVMNLNFNSIEARADTATNHSYAMLEWNIDLSLTDELCLSQSLSTQAAGSASVGQILKLAYRTNPAIAVLEVATEPGSTSCLGLEALASDAVHFSSFHFISNGPKQLLSIQDRHSEIPNASFHLLNAVAPNTVITTDHVDFAILRINPHFTLADVSIAVDNIFRSLHEHGQLLLVNEAGQPNPAPQSIISLLQEKFARVKNLSGAAGKPLILAESPRSDKIVSADKAPPEVDLVCVRFINNDAILPVLDYLRNWGLNIRIHEFKTDRELTAQSTVICLDELFDVVTAEMTSIHWAMLQSIVRAECRLLWVTSGAQMDVTEPDRAASQGLFRVIRSEEPHLRIVTLDVEKPSAPASWSATRVLLDALLQSENPFFTMQNEFAERGGAIYTPRVVPDEAINKAKFDHIKGRKTDPVDFSATDRHIQWRPERTGDHDSLQFAEIATEAIKVGGEDVEVELHAVGVNLNDVVLVQGVVDESLAWK